MPRRNKKLFQEVAACIRTWPEAYDQEVFWNPADSQIEPVEVTFADGTKVKMKHCSSQQCIAGWGALLRGWVPDSLGGSDSVVKNDQLLDIVEAAAKEYGITLDEAEILFDYNWKPYNQRDSKAVRVEKVAKALEAFAEGAPIERQYAV